MRVERAGERRERQTHHHATITRPTPFLATTHTTKHSGIHHTHGYITPTPPSITHHHQSTTTLIHPHNHHDLNPPIYKMISMTKDPKPKTHDLHPESTSMLI